MKTCKRGKAKMLTGVILLLGMIAIIIGMYAQRERGVIPIQTERGVIPIQTFRDSFLQAYIQWDEEKTSIFWERPGMSILSEEQLRRIDEAYKKHLVPLGPMALPYMIVIAQHNHWIGGAIFQISKFNPHNIILRRKPGDLLSTTEEFPEVTERRITYHAPRVFLLWWLEGEKRTPKWFAERYSKWLALRKQVKTDEAKEAKEWLDLLNEPWKRWRHNLTMYQKLLDIGIAAIPLWLEKLRVEKDADIRQAIMEALSALTDGEVNSSMSVQECLNWWKANKERWTIPFPKSKEDFLKWLEKETWEEVRLSIACSVTISRLEDEIVIDALLHLLKHPNPLTRATCLERLQMLFGEQLPKEYSLGVGTDEWESIRDLMDVGKFEIVERKAVENWEKMKDRRQAEKAAKELSDWWKNKRGKVKIYWQRAWEFISFALY